ncbi:hypothetical protein JXB11_02400 [Candidatus Woesearchaeota archaeon]|nr:hypothetical protein [Candidatus Woesearchaeota archaeon]
MRFGKKVSVELKGDAIDAYSRLNTLVGKQRLGGIRSSDEISLWNSVQRAFDLISDNPFYGRNVRKKQIPAYYLKKFGAGNLFVVSLSLFWRLVYSLEGSRVEIVAFVLDIFSHEEYGKRFGYKRK